MNVPVNQRSSGVLRLLLRRAAGPGRSAVPQVQSRFLEQISHVGVPSVIPGSRVAPCKFLRNGLDGKVWPLLSSVPLPERAFPG
jgi:hypothetical protein